MAVTNGTNVYTRAPSSPASLAGMGTAYIFFFDYITAPGTVSITVSFSGCSGSSMDIWADEFSGVSVLDVDAKATSGTGTTINSPSLTPSQANEALFNVCLAGGTIGAVSTPWSMDPVSNGNDAAWMIAPDTSARAVGYIQSGGSGWACAEAAFK